MQQPTSESASDPSQTAQAAQLELQRRIESLEALDESELGEFTRKDWIICTLGSLVIPSLVLLWIGR